MLARNLFRVSASNVFWLVLEMRAFTSMTLILRTVDGSVGVKSMCIGDDL